jgi:hypothetical protein
VLLPANSLGCQTGVKGNALRNLRIGRTGMEDERFRALLETVTNFNWEGPRSSALRAEYEEQKAKQYDLWDASRDEAEKAKLWGMYKAPAPAAVRAEYDEIRKRLREYQRALRRDFPEWHYSDGSRVRQFVGRDGLSQGAIQSELRNVWQLASTGKADKAKRKLRKMSESFALNVDRALATTDSWYNREKRETEVVPRKARPNEAATLRQMVETLEWLQRRLGSLKVCENPKCVSGRKYFFKVYPNDTYCCARCIKIAKALRKAKRDAESQKPPRVPNFSEETRSKMRMSAVLRHANERASKGKN